MSKKDDGIDFDRSTVVQEARIFDQSPVDARRCRALLARVAWLLYNGQQPFSTDEATALFVGITKLFQNRDSSLRQMSYLVLKELCASAQNIVFVAVAVISKDMQSSTSAQDAIYRPNAIRALYKVSEPGMIQGHERFFRAAIVDKSASIASAALVSAYHMHATAPDIIKRWAPEVSEALSGKATQNSASTVAQYHAIGLLYHLRDKDRMAVVKLVQQLSQARSGTLKNSMAICMLIRYSAKVLSDDPNMHKQIFDMLEAYLRHKSDMVNLEAARAICGIANLSADELTRTVAVLQSLLGSNKPVLKFAAVRTLSGLALTHPSAVVSCNVDMEGLITDSNRSIATFAITTLLKTGNEASVDRLMKQITSFMAEISDEFKVIVVDAIRALCLKFPAKQGVMLSFLSNILRDEGGYDFKKAVVEAIFDLIDVVTDAKDSALAHLCEFIEDCEFTKLSVRILHLLGIEGPKASNPTKYIRYIYNRVVLENAVVRAAAVSALAKFGTDVKQASVKNSIRVLLTRCLDDVDDEVRDRAVLFLNTMDKEEPTKLPRNQIWVMDSLESKLSEYLASDQGATLDISAVPTISRSQLKQDALKAKLESSFQAVASTSQAASTSTPQPLPATASETQLMHAEHLASIAQFKTYGKLLGSSLRPHPLTESETEYNVAVTKHIYSKHIVFQFEVKNTLPDTILENVGMILAPTEDVQGLTEELVLPATLIGNNEVGHIYIAFSRSEPSQFASGTFSCSLVFTSKEVDPSTGLPENEGYPDEYQVEACELTASDYIRPCYAAFDSEWTTLSGAKSSSEVFALSALDSLQSACKSLTQLLNMEALGGTEIPQSLTVHSLHLSGQIAGVTDKILVLARMTFAAGQGVTLELNARSSNQSACDLVISAIA